jgi:hypothetical protein
MLTSKILSHRPTGPAFGRPEDRLRPVPMAKLGPGLRREDKEGSIILIIRMHLSTREEHPKEFRKYAGDLLASYDIPEPPPVR